MKRFIKDSSSFQFCPTSLQLWNVCVVGCTGDLTGLLYNHPANQRKKARQQGPAGGAGVDGGSLEHQKHQLHSSLHIQGLKQLPIFSNILAALERLCGWLHWGFNWSSLQSPTFPLLNFQVVSCCLA